MYRDQILGLFAHSDQELPKPKIESRDPFLGPEYAKLAIFGFEDFKCVFCKQMQPVIKKAIEDHPGRVKYVWKDFPANILHPNVSKAHEAARCAEDQGAFWEYHDKLYEWQDDLSMEVYYYIADELGLEREKFSKCLQSGEKEGLISEKIAEGLSLGVDGTPYFFIGNLRITSAISSFGFLQIIEDSLRGSPL